MAERVGFEPTVEFPLHTLSKRAPSTTRTSLLTSRSGRRSAAVPSGPRLRPRAFRMSGINSLPEVGHPLNRRLRCDCDVRLSGMGLWGRQYGPRQADF